MDKRTGVLKTLIIGLLVLFFPALLLAAQDAGETVTKRGTVNDDYYAAGSTVDIDADIAGDVIAVGGTVLIDGRIRGDVMGGGGTVNVRGEIEDDVRMGGGTVNIDAKIADDLIAVGGTLDVSRKTVIGGTAWLAGGEVTVAATITHDLFIAAGNISLSGVVLGNVEIDGDEIRISEGALINGNLIYKSPEEAKIHPTAVVKGDIIHKSEERRPDRIRGLGIVLAITMMVAGMALFLVFPGFTLAATGRISSNPGRSLVLGIIFLIAVPVGAILLLCTVLGVWIGLAILAFYLVALPVGFLIACFFLGERGALLLRRNIASKGRRILSLLIAIVVLGLIGIIPVVGGAILFAALLFGLGAGALQLHHVYKWSNEKY